MAPTYLFLLALLLGVPLYIALRAMSIVFPAYGTLLAFSMFLIWFGWQNPKQIVSDDIILGLIVVIACLFGLVGFAIAPLIVQITIALGLLLYQRSHQQS